MAVLFLHGGSSRSQRRLILAWSGLGRLYRKCDRVAFGTRAPAQLHVRGRRRGTHATVFDNRPRVPYVKIGQYTASHVRVKTDICPEYLLSGWLCVTFPL